MIGNVASRAASQRVMATLVSRRAFHATRARMSSPYHYPEGPYSNLPFNPKTRFFGLRFFLYCATGFFLPFGISGTSVCWFSARLLNVLANFVASPLPSPYLVYQTYKPKP